MRTLPSCFLMTVAWLSACNPEPVGCALTDGDGDGFAAFEAGCSVGEESIDCDDADPRVHPAANEQCGGPDEDCDGLYDNADPDVVGTERLWYRDLDGDGAGDPEHRWAACAKDPGPAGFVANDEDCNDHNPAVRPGHGCAPPCADPPTWFADRDDDGFGDARVFVARCRAPEGFVAQSGDCEDGDPKIHPAAAEACNSYDDDCDAQVDEVDSSFVGPTWEWLADADEDGFGDEGRPVVTCSPFPGLGLTDMAGDCDDGDPDVHPEAEEWCDDVDQDCDGVAWLPQTAMFEAGERRTDWSSRFGGRLEPEDAGALHLCDGVFVGQLDSPHGLRVVGHGAARLDGGGGGPVVRAGGELALHDLEIVGGGLGDAAVAHEGSSLEMERCVVHDNPGGGVRTAASRVRLTGVELVGNTASAGSALRLEAPRVDATVTGGRLFDNLAQDGAAIAVDGAGALTLRRVNFEVNRGGAVHGASLDALIIEDGFFVGNTADAVANVIGSRWYTQISGSSFAGNLTRVGPATLWMAGVAGNGRAASELELVNTSFVGNIGGAIAARDVTLRHTGGSLVDNHAGRGGPAVWLDGRGASAAWTAVGVTVRGNAVDGGGAGGAVLLAGVGLASLLDVRMEENHTAGVGGALAAVGGWELGCERTAFLNNAAAQGGALWLDAVEGAEPALHAFGCDFGVRSNAPDDLATAKDSWVLPGVVDVVCTWAGGCR